MAEQDGMKRSLEGRIALVTGGASGIGRAVAEVYAKAGASVAVLDIDGDAAREVAKQLSVFRGAALGAFVDVADTESVTEAVDRVFRELGGVDVLCNSAALPAAGSVLETVPADWRRTIEVNLDGPYLLSRAVIPSMMKRGGGSIVHIASVQGIASMPDSAAYAASKGGLLALTRAMAVDHSPLIRVNAIAPGAVRTPMLLRGATEASPDDPEAAVVRWGASHPMGRVVEASEVADAALFLSTDASRMITGSCVVVDGGLTARLAL